MGRTATWARVTHLWEVLDLVCIAAAPRGEGEERQVDPVGGQASIGGGCRPQASIADTALGRTRDRLHGDAPVSDASQVQIGASTTQDTRPRLRLLGTRIHMSR